jgi:hypothetical protein
MLALGPIAFVAPWMLTALVLLPALWWLLRVTPPSSRRIRFPAVRMLLGLESPEETPSKTPLWLVLLRLTATSLLILALAHPLLNPSSDYTGTGPMILVVDDGWAAARDWPARQNATKQLLDQAEHSNRAVIILTTAASEQGLLPVASNTLQPSAAQKLVDAIKPKPWPTNRSATIKAIESLEITGSASAVWLSDGLDGPDAAELAEHLQRLGSLRVLRPETAALPRLLLPPSANEQSLDITVRRIEPGAKDVAALRAIARDGRLLARETVAIPADVREASVSLTLPAEMRNELARLEIEGESTAGAVVLLDERWRRRPIGLVSDNAAAGGPSLLNELYFIDRAVSPFSEVRKGDISQLLDGGNAVTIVPDGQPLGVEDRKRLDSWIREGGLLLRFAGPRIAQRTERDLVPVVLRRGGRALGGSMQWTTPARLAPFEASSPFFGLVIPDDATVSRQVLAEPSLDLGQKTWAKLVDGTPLVTAERRGEGWLVLVHTTSNTEWSNLALSGLFVELLQRIARMSRGVAGEGALPLAPLDSLDGFGRLAPPPPAARSIAAADFASSIVSPQTPPGFYGTDETRRALNLAPDLHELSALTDLPPGVVVEGYERASEMDLKPTILAIVLAILLADTVIALAMRGLLPLSLFRRREGIASAFAGSLVASAVLSTLITTNAQAQTSTLSEQAGLDATLNTHLAYVLTGSQAIDDVSHAGLEGLSLALNLRTAIEAAPPIGVDLSVDELAFFPLLYWPITARPPSLSLQVVSRIERFLSGGGTILFDTRNQGGASGLGPSGRALGDLARRLGVPQLTPVPADHVLTKSFYLLQDFPGRWADGRVWIEVSGENVNDGVARIIVGSNDWASAWAIDQSGQPMFPVVPGGERQREMALRFGVNLLMYTLTGNYKTDQVHVPAILERLGQ